MTTLLTSARRAAAATPPDRDRVVDLVRVAAMAVVVFGHWIMAAIWASPGGPVTGNALDDSVGLQVATWAFQVMPLFFLAGGFSNRASLLAARRDGVAAGHWLAARGRRLLAPVVPLVVVWAAITVVARPFVDPGLLRAGTMVSLVPLWFLAVYVGVVVLAPITHRLWERWGWWTVAAGAAAAVAVDVLRFVGDQAWLGWANFLFVWATVHQIGYGWERWRSPRVGRWLAPAGFAALVLAVGLGPYPISMIGLDGQAVTNTTPPTIALLLLGVMQAGVLGLFAPSLERWLGRRGPWTAVVLTSGMAMTWYAWHLTVMTLVAGLGFLAGGWFLTPEPLGASWWATRPLWLVGLTLCTIPVVLVALRFEVKGAGPTRPDWVVVLGLLGATATIAWLTLRGVSTIPVVGFLAAAFAAGALPGHPRDRVGAGLGGG
jgi:hypothetical protein